MSTWFDDLVKGDIPFAVAKILKAFFFGSGGVSRSRSDNVNSKPKRCNAMLWQCPKCGAIGCLEKDCSKSLTAGTGYCGCNQAPPFKGLPGSHCTGLRS